MYCRSRAGPKGVALLGLLRLSRRIAIPSTMVIEREREVIRTSRGFTFVSVNQYQNVCVLRIESGSAITR